MKFRPLVAIQLLLALLATGSPAWGDPWWDVDWRSRMKLTFDNSGQIQDLPAFPVLVVLDSSRIHYDKTQNQGEDIRFIDGGTGLPLAYEIEEWNESGKSYVWVKVPQIDGSSNTDYIWLYYDNPSAVDDQKPADVWTNGYVGVWHLRDDPGPGNPGDILDSTAANNNGTAEASMQPGDLVGGQIGKALDFDGVDDYIDIGQNPTINIGGDLSVEFWLKTSATSALGNDTPDDWFRGQRIVDKDVEGVPKGWGIANHYSKIKFNVEDNAETVVSTTTINDDQWYYVVGVRDVDFGDKWLYINGAIDASTTNGSKVDASSSDPLQFARSDDADPSTYVQGGIDEIRISNVERTADWVAAQYLSMTDTFIGYGTGPVAFVSNRNGNPEIYVMDPDGSNQVRLTNHPNVDTSPARSPDGRRIAFATDRDGNLEIYVMDSDGFNLNRLTTNGSLDDHPAWSPDGKRIAFHSNRDGNDEIYVMNADGSGGQSNISNDPAIDINPTWSPDGKRIAFTSKRDGNLEVYVMDDDGGNPVNLTGHPNIDDLAAWSPDGSQIAFTTYRDLNFEIYVMGADGSFPTNLTNNGAGDEAPDWSPDGSKILFHTDRGADVEVYEMDAGGTNPNNLTQWANDDTDPAWGQAFGTFGFRKYITIDRTRIPGGCGPTISNYPMLYSVTDPDLKGKIFGGKIQDPNGYDMVFRALNDGTCVGDGPAPCKLDFEIEYYDASTGELVVWIRIPSVYTSSATSNTVIAMDYGNEDITYSMQNPAGVWDPNYVGVWHLNEAVVDGQSVGIHLDSTSNANHGAQVNNATTAGKMANAQEFDGDDAIDMGDIDALDGVQMLTTSAWVRLDALTDWGTVLAKGVDTTQSWGQMESTAGQEGSDDVSVGIRDGVEDGWNTNNNILSTDGEFHMWTMVYDGTQSADADRITFYFDGQQQATVPASSGTVAPATDVNNTSLQVGNAPYGAFGLVGAVDEVRASNIVRDACWIEANFKNVDAPGDIGSPGFYAVGAEAPLPETLTLSSSDNQIFVTGDPPTAAVTITVKDDTLAGTITDAHDLRIRIPSGFNMTWDTTVTTVSLGGAASGKVDNVLLAYEDGGRTAVLNVISDFARGDEINVSGLAFANFAGASPPDSLILEVKNDGLPSATDDKTIEILAGTDTTIVSAFDQMFHVGSPSIPIATITVTHSASKNDIRATNALRIRIPVGFNMTWDTGDTSADLAGPAAARVSSTVSYEDLGHTLVLDVLNDFVLGEHLTISGLSFTNFTDTSAPDKLELVVNGPGGPTQDEDARAKSITNGAARILKLVGFETGDLSELESTSIDSYIATAPDVRAGSGSYCLRQEESPSALVAGLTPGLKTLAIRFSFKPNAFLFSTKTMLEFKNGVTGSWALQLIDDGTLQILDIEGLGLSASGPSSEVLSNPNYYTIRMVYDNAAGGILMVYLDDKRIFNLTHSNAGLDIDTIEIAGGDSPLGYYYDDFFLTDAPALPPMGQIMRISPMATNTGDFDYFSGSVDHERNVDGDFFSEVNDGDYNWHTGYAATDLYALSASPAGKINAVKGMWRMRFEDTGDPGPHDVVWYENGAASSAGFSGITNLWSTEERIWETPPNSGGGWTTAIVDDLQLGASHAGAFGDHTYISWAAAMVDYDVTVTAVELTSFTATGLDTEVLLEWETASEVDNLGFFLYRSESETGPYTRINNEPVPGLLDSEAGAGYRYVDSELTNGTTYFYLLEDFEIGGATKQHGPVSATPEEGASSDAVDGLPISGETPAVITYGDPSLVSFKILEHGRRHMVLELITGGFHAGLQGDGSVRLEIPGFVEESGPGLPAVPVKRSWVEAISGRKVKVTSVEAYQVEAISGLRLSNTTAPQIVVSGITVQAGRSPAEAQQAFTQAGLYPEETARILSTGFQGEVKKALVELAPLRWDESAAELLLARRLVVRLAFTGRESKETSFGGSRGRQIRNKNPERNVVVRFELSEPGLYGVSYESVFGRRGRVVPSSVLRLSRQGEPVAYHLEPDNGSFARGSVLYFVSEGASLTPYAKEVVYELELGAQGETMPVVPASPSGQSSSFCWQRVEREENRLFSSSAQTINRWTWGPIYAATSKSYLFEVNGLVTSGAEMGRLELSVQGFSKVPETEYRLRISINGEFVGEHSWTGDEPYDFTLDYPPVHLWEGENQLTIENATGVHSGMLLDWFAVSYPRALTAVDGILEGRWSESGVAEISGLGPQAYLLDITEQPPQWLTGAEASLRFRAEAERSYLAVAGDAVLTPEARISYAESLRSTKYPVDYLVVGPRSFLSTVQPLLDLRREQGLRSRAVSIEEVYDAFGYGESSPQALQEFLAYVYHHWPQPSPRYVLLVGDATYDFKDYLGTGTENQVPPLQVRTRYLWTASDPSYAAVNGQDPFPDFAIGRLPASTAEELRVMVAKLLAYETGEMSLSGPAVLVADNTDPGGNFQATAEALASGVLASQELTKIYLGRLGTASTRRAVVEAFDRGASLMSYIGHGSVNLWAQEKIFENATVGELLPQSQQPVVLTMNCYNGWFSIPGSDSLSEELVKADGRGAIAAFSPSGLSLNAPAHWLHRALLEELLSGRHATLGDAVLAAQAAYADTGAFPELLSIFHLFGDPAMQIR